MFGWINRTLGSPRESNYKDNRDSSNLIADVLLQEVEPVYIEKVRQQEDLQRSQLSLQTGGADYSWLAIRRSDCHLSEYDRNRIQNAALDLRPCECNKFITLFRSRVQSCINGQQVMEVFCKVMQETKSSRPRTPSTSSNQSWIAYILERTTNSNKVCDLGTGQGGIDLEEVRISPAPASPVQDPFQVRTTPVVIDLTDNLSNMSTNSITSSPDLRSTHIKNSPLKISLTVKDETVLKTES